MGQGDKYSVWDRGLALPVRLQVKESRLVALPQGDYQDGVTASRRHLDHQDDDVILMIPLGALFDFIRQANRVII